MLFRNFTFPNYNFCLDKPAWHEGRCCPHRDEPLPGSVQFKKNLRATMMKGPRSRGPSDRDGSSGTSGDSNHNNEPELFRPSQRTPRSSPRSAPSASSSGRGSRTDSTTRSVRGKVSKTYCPYGEVSTNSKKPKKSYGSNKGG